jgi:hypothetical protein
LDPSSKIADYWAYLELQAGLPVSMKSSYLLISDFFTSSPSNISVFFTFESKTILGSIFCTRRGKEAEDLEKLLMIIVHIDLAQ